MCAGEAPKSKAAASILTHQLQRRLLPKTDMQLRAQNSNISSQNAKKPNKNNDVDEIGGNEINRVSDLYNFVDDLPNNDNAAKQGEYQIIFLLSLHRSNNGLEISFENV